MAVKNLVPTGIQSPDRPARSKSLYRLRYPGPVKCPVYSLMRINITGQFDDVSTSFVIELVNTFDRNFVQNTLPFNNPQFRFSLI
jgi:hypothetical protein